MHGSRMPADSLPNISILEVHPEAIGMSGKRSFIKPIICAVARDTRIEINRDSATFRALVKAGIIDPNATPEQFGFSSGN
jgi:hypothetical protein